MGHSLAFLRTGSISLSGFSTCAILFIYDVNMSWATNFRGELAVGVKCNTRFAELTTSLPRYGRECVMERFAQSSTVAR